PVVSPPVVSPPVVPSTVESVPVSWPSVPVSPPVSPVSEDPPVTSPPAVPSSPVDSVPEPSVDPSAPPSVVVVVDAVVGVDASGALASLLDERPPEAGEQELIVSDAADKRTRRILSMSRNLAKLAPLTMALVLMAAALPARAGVFRSALETPAQFTQLSKRVGGERFAKFVIDIKTGAVIYFDVNVYEMHTQFVFKEILKVEQTNERLFDFNRNYSPIKPQFLLGYLVHHVEPDVWTVGFYSGDRLTADHVRHTIQRVQQTFYAGSKLLFLPDSMHQARLAESMPDVPQISRDTLYKAASYQPFSLGKAVGILRIVTAEQAKQPERLKLSADDIVILPHDLPDIAVVSGIITETFSTPLAHVALRARAWRIPHVGRKDAGRLHAALAGKVVVMEASLEGYTMRQATAAEISAWRAAQTVERQVQVPSLDIGPHDLRALHGTLPLSPSAFGAKASNLALIARNPIPGVLVPRGVTIPVAWYAEHLARHKISVPTDESQLKAVRRAIQAAPLDPALVARIKTALGELQLPAGAGVFVRSSTNAEDLPGFNGAGLYDTVPNVRGDVALAGAVRQVWASVWNLRAFRERAHFGIDHKAVHAAVLLQLGVNATAAGVLVTADLLDPSDHRTFTINAKWGLGIRVVEGKKIPEQILYELGTRTARVVSRSDERTQLIFDSDGGVREVVIEKPGQPILNDRRAEQLALAANEMQRFLGWPQPLDIEWLFEGDILHIVQVRPYITAGPDM
ncbi:MAG: hypothetical protein ACI9WU_001022, partial [Myxococcota bacterium]